MSANQDILLLNRLRKGDLRAFDELYLKYYKLLCASAYFFLKSEQEAKDLVQTLFLDIWDKKLYDQFHCDIKGYLFRSVKHRCLNHIRWQKVQHLRHRGYAELQDQAGPATMEAVSDSYLRLRSALDDMPVQKKVAIQMVYMHGKRYQDAADAMRISINSLKTHLKTGLKLLRGEFNSKVN
jgi:RNA polymerase sigma-70 factor (ECF subfamily)